MTTGYDKKANRVLGLVFVLFAAANFPSKIRDAVKHPQVTALGVWALAHLLANGELDHTGGRHAVPLEPLSPGIPAA